MWFYVGLLLCILFLTAMWIRDGANLRRLSFFQLVYPVAVLLAVGLYVLIWGR